MARVDTSTLAGIAEASNPTTPAAPTTPTGVTNPNFNFTPNKVDPATQALIDATNALAKATSAQTNAATAASVASDSARQQQETNWIAAGKMLLTQYNLGSLGDRYMGLITSGGMDQATAMLELQTTAEWKARFIGNESRLKQGLPVLSPADYLATEASYKDIMINAGLPNAAINDVNYLGQLISADVSPVEVKQRVDAARIALNSEDPYVIQQLQQEFGLSRGDMAMHLLDSKVASNIIAQKVTAAQIGGEASREGTNVSQDYAMQLAAQGITQGQAAAGFTSIANQLPGTQALASRYTGYGDAGSVGQSLQNATFATNTGGESPAQAEARLKRLQTQEVSAFGGSAGASTQGQSLGVGNAQGVS